MQIVWNRVNDRAEGVTPGGLAGWVLGVIEARVARKAAKHLRVLEHLSLGGRCQLTLIACDGERFLVGGGADGVETIVRIGPQQGEEAPCR